MASKIITKRTSKTIEPIDQDVLYKEESECCSSGNCSKEKIFKKHLPFLIIVIVLIVVLSYFFKDKIVVAMVNGKPVFGYTLNQRLTKSYGKETLENIIVEQLIKDEAKKKGVTVSEDDVKAEIDKVTKSLGTGITLDDALKYQGISLADFRQQLKIRLEVNKILEKDITVTNDEVNQFIKENAKLLTASGEAERKSEAEAKLKEQKISDKIQTWVSDLLAKAKITRYLK